MNSREAQRCVDQCEYSRCSLVIKLTRVVRIWKAIGQSASDRWDRDFQLPTASGVKKLRSSGDLTNLGDFERRRRLNLDWLHISLWRRSSSSSEMTPGHSSKLNENRRYYPDFQSGRVGEVIPALEFQFAFFQTWQTCSGATHPRLLSWKFLPFTSYLSLNPMPKCSTLANSLPPILTRFNCAEIGRTRKIDYCSTLLMAKRRSIGTLLRRKSVTTLLNSVGNDGWFNWIPRCEGHRLSNGRTTSFNVNDSGLGIIGR
jgi:hypothetical protein